MDVLVYLTPSDTRLRFFLRQQRLVKPRIFGHKGLRGAGCHQKLFRVICAHDLSPAGKKHPFQSILRSQLSRLTRMLQSLRARHRQDVEAQARRVGDYTDGPPKPLNARLAL